MKDSKEFQSFKKINHLLIQSVAKLQHSNKLKLLPLSIILLLKSKWVNDFKLRTIGSSLIQIKEFRPLLDSRALVILWTNLTWYHEILQVPSCAFLVPLGAIVYLRLPLGSFRGLRMPSGSCRLFIASFDSNTHLWFFRWYHPVMNFCSTAISMESNEIALTSLRCDHP